MVETGIRNSCLVRGANECERMLLFWELCSGEQVVCSAKAMQIELEIYIFNPNLICY